MPSKVLFPDNPLTLSVKKLTLTKDVTPLDLFTPLANEPWAMWLDSGQSEHIDACFDILVWQPEVTLCTYGDKTQVHHTKNNKVVMCEEDPLSLLENVQQQILTKLASSKQVLPFLGGALGYFSYDLGRRFEKLPVQAEQDINLPEMAVGIYAQAIIFDHKRKQIFLICQEDKRVELEVFLQTIINKKQSRKTEQQNFVLTSSWQSNMDKASYIDKFKQIQQFLSSGDCYQINLSQRFSANYQGNEFQAYIALRSENKAPFSAFIRLENTAILSLSPERFLQLSQGKVQSKPIKGTMPRSTNKQQDAKNAQQLANSTKDRAENVMIVDLLRNDISKVCKANSVVVPKLFDIESFPAVHHLVSTVEGQLAEQYNACDLLRGAFPGGSITGAPKIRAMEIIEQLEPHRRSVYCGSIGYISSCGTMDTSITIRTLICQKSEIKNNQGKLYCSAGGGLVADSIATSEYQETFDKVNRILPVLEKFSATKINELNIKNKGS
ncbi:aminodeoxychorismate synthase component I [Candidatus Colwellia aromaticivorans]|uniref:aminodeoxychorismate synthase component I n=1 Tax=Candidatus Colwellia aromaticivorans TaxID=2267621 RepID=UPI000DF1F07E|nr:aminodeoxychorismate synthase component I [Candidatus Colwellia aromaticivorans]